MLASNLFNCHKEVINALPVPSISRCIHIVYRHKNVWEYQWSNFIYNCMSTFLHSVHCKDALLDCSAPGGEKCESLTWVDEIEYGWSQLHICDELQSRLAAYCHNILLCRSIHHTILWNESHQGTKFTLCLKFQEPLFCRRNEHVCWICSNIWTWRLIIYTLLPCASISETNFACAGL